MKFTYLVALFMFTLIIGTLGFSVKEGVKGKPKPRNTGQNMYTGGGATQNMNASGRGKKISNK